MIDAILFIGGIVMLFIVTLYVTCLMFRFWESYNYSWKELNRLSDKYLLMTQRGKV